MVAPADRFLTECRRRVWLPLGICATHCPGRSCNALLDTRGLHLLSCHFAGRLQSRAYPLERASCKSAARPAAACRARSLWFAAWA